jgi:hypothetical protein
MTNLYYIYRTDFGNTIIRKNSFDTSTGGTEQSLYSDFILNEIQPIYFWRITGGTTIINNLENNISAWINYIAPSNIIDIINYNQLTGTTVLSDNVTLNQLVQTIVPLNTNIISLSGKTENKISKIVGGIINNIPTIIADGSLIDSGLNVNNIIAAGSGVTNINFNTFTGVTIPNLLSDKANLIHTHPYSGLTNLPNLGVYAHESNLTGHTSDSTIHFKQSGITIAERQVTNLVLDLAGKSSTGHTHNQYLLTGGTAICANTAGNALCLNNQTANYYLNTGSTSICTICAISAKALCGCVPASFLLSGDTAKNATCLGGNLANTYLSTIGCAADSAKLNNKSASYYLNSGSTALCASIANNALCLGGNLANTYASLNSPIFSGTIQGASLQLSGDLIVSGTMHSIYTEHVYTKDNFIFMRSGTTSGLGVNEISGIAIEKADSINTVILGSDMNGTMRVGWSGSTLVALAGREDSPHNGWYAKWDSGTTKFITYDLKTYIDNCNNNKLNKSIYQTYTGTTAPNIYLGINSTACCAVTAGNSLCLCGCIPTCFLGINACACDSAKLNNKSASFYLNTGSTALCSTSSINSKALCGCIPSSFLLSGSTAVCATTAGNALKLNNQSANYYLNTGSTITCAADSNKLNNKSSSYYLNTGSTALCATCAIGAKNLCDCVPANFLLSGGTAVCATCAGNASTIAGCTPSCFLGATACASDSTKLNNKLSTYYLNTGSTAINSLTLCGCVPLNFLLSGGTALCSTTAGNALKLNNQSTSYYLNTGSTAICSSNSINSKALCGCVPANFLLSGGTAVCATTAGNSLCLGGKLPAYYLNTGSTSICSTSSINSKALCGCVPLNFLLSGGTALCATNAINSACLAGCVPANFLLSGATACCAVTANNALCLGSNLASSFLQTQVFISCIAQINNNMIAYQIAMS